MILSGSNYYKLKELINKKLPIIDNNALTNFDFRSKIESEWNSLVSPLQVSKDLWFCFDPKAIAISQCKREGMELSTTIGIQCFPKIIYQEVKPVQDKQSLPEIKMDNDTSSDFHIHLFADLSYLEATKLINENLRNKTFNFKNYHVTIDECNISGAGKTMLIEVKISGSIKGDFYFVATPVFDSESQMITVKDFDFSMETKNALLKTADWLLHSDLKNIVNSKVKFNVKDQLSKAEKDLSLSMNRRINNNLSMTGNITSISILGLYLMDNGIKTIVKVNGRLDLQYQ